MADHWRRSVRPGLGRAIPAVLAQLRQKRRIQRPTIAEAGVGQYVVGLAHTDDGRAHGVIRKHKSQRKFGETHAFRQNSLEALDPLDRWLEVFRTEVACAPVVRRES